MRSTLYSCGLYLIYRMNYICCTNSYVFVHVYIIYYTLCICCNITNITLFVRVNHIYSILQHYEHYRYKLTFNTPPFCKIHIIKWTRNKNTPPILPPANSNNARPPPPSGNILLDLHWVRFKILSVIMPQLHFGIKDGKLNCYCPFYNKSCQIATCLHVLLYYSW